MWKMSDIDTELIDELTGFAEQASSQCFEEDDDGMPIITKESTNRSMSVKLSILTEGLNTLKQHPELEWKQLKFLILRKINYGPKTTICYECGKVISEQPGDEPHSVYVDVGKDDDGRQLAGKAAHCTECKKNGGSSE